MIDNFDSWMATSSVNLFVKKQYFHHHAFEILDSHRKIKDFVQSSLNQPIPISPRIKNTKQLQSRAIKADNLNVQIRNLLKGVRSDVDIKFEVVEENGVFYFASEKSSIGGFDFAILNNEANLLALRNLCFGELQYHDAEQRWNRFLQKNPDLLGISEIIYNLGSKGTNIKRNKSTAMDPLIVGEIQFGNWALAYRDFFKVLKADVQNNIDCLIYIVPCDNLEKALSDGIVTFDKTVKIIEDFAKVINVPVWLIGLDID